MILSMVTALVLAGAVPEPPVVAVPLPVAAPPAPPPKPKPGDLSRPGFPLGNPGYWVTNDDYPVRAMREEREGTVGFRLTYGSDGLVSGCAVTQGSGSVDLDNATCALISKRAHFSPGLDAKGELVGGTYSNRVRWMIPDPVQAVEAFPQGPVAHFGDALSNPKASDFPPGALASELSGRVRVMLDIGQDGAVRSCKAVGLPAPSSLVEASCPYVLPQAQFSPAVDLDGQPTEGRYAMILVWQADPIPPANNLRRTATRLDPGSVSLSITAGADGYVRDCRRRTVGTPPFDAVPPEMCDVLERIDPYLDSDGKPVARRITIRFSVNVDSIDAPIRD